MKTIHMVFVGGPECGAMRVLPGPIPALRIPVLHSEPPRSYCYTLTEERDHAGRFLYRYVGEQ